MIEGEPAVDELLAEGIVQLLIAADRVETVSTASMTVAAQGIQPPPASRLDEIAQARVVRP